MGKYLKKLTFLTMLPVLFFSYQNCSQQKLFGKFESSSTGSFACSNGELAKGMNNSNIDSAPILAACLNSDTRPTTVVLPVGNYYLKTPLNIVRSGTIISSGYNVGNSTRCSEDGSNCATLIAHPSYRPVLNGAVVAAVVFIDAPNVLVSNMVFDGNKNNRIVYDGDPGVTFYFTHDNSTLANSVVKNGLKGCSVCVWGNWVSSPAYKAWFPYTSPPTNMEYVQVGPYYYGVGMNAFVNNLTFENNAIVDSGIHGMRQVALKDPITDTCKQIDPATQGCKQTYIPGWADGLNIAHGSNVTVKGNLLRDNTDIDLIFGGAWNSNISNNTIQHTGSADGTSWAALAVQSWPYTMGHYDGLNISGNQISCPNLSCAFGILIGVDPWNSMPELTGKPVTGRFSLSNNNVTGPIVATIIARIRSEDSKIVSFDNGFEVLPWLQSNNFATLNGNTFQAGTSSIPIISFSSNPTRARITPLLNFLIDSSNTSQVSLTNSGNPTYYTTANDPYNAYLPLGFFPKHCLQNPPFTGTKEKVRESYCRTLGREPDPSGLDSWTTQVSQGQITLVDLHKTLYQAEGQTAYVKQLVDAGDQGFVISLYIAFLERLPDAAGLTFYTGQLSSGAKTRDQLIDSFLNSSEFQSLIQ